MKLSLITLFFLLSSCAFDNLERRNVDEYFNSSGVIQYFLPDLPAWANTVDSVQCHRSESVRFFDFEKLNASFGLDYERLIQLQLAFNQERKQDMALTEEERVFFSVSERIQADIYPFKKPQFEKIHLVIVDPFMRAETYRELHALVNSQSFAQGQPVFASICYSEQEIRKLIDDLGFTGGYAVISAAMFTPYNEKMQLTPGMSLNLSELFGADKSITLYNSQSIVPVEFKGNFKTKKF